jgi:DNA-binding NarL/FixJ family response regulator
LPDKKIVIFDDVLHARREEFHIPGLEVVLHQHADEAAVVCARAEVVFMDFAMGEGHLTGADACRALRAAGFKGKIVAMSSDPDANARMVDAGADEALGRKALLRSYLVALGSTVDS